MATSDREPTEQQLYHIPLPPYTANYQAYPDTGQPIVPAASPGHPNAPIPDEPPPPYEACFLPQAYSLEDSNRSPPPPYSSSDLPSLAPKIPTPRPFVQTDPIERSVSNSLPEPEIPVRTPVPPPRIGPIPRHIPQQLVLPKIILRLRYYQFVLGFSLAIVGIVGQDLHYFGSECGLGIIAGLIALAALAWTDPRRKLFCLRNNERFHYAMFMAANGLALIAVLAYALFHCYGIYIDSHRMDADKTSAMINQGVGVGIAWVLMLVMLSKWIKTKSLTDQSVGPEPPPPINLPPLSRGITRLNVCIVCFCCATLFSIGGCGIFWRYYGYKLGAGFLASGVAFLTLIYYGDPRSRIQGQERRRIIIYQISNAVVMLLGLYYICVHSYGISVDLTLKDACGWTAVVNNTICRPPDRLAEVPFNVAEGSQRVYLQLAGIFFACCLIFAHVLKWKRLKDENLL